MQSLKMNDELRQLLKGAGIEKNLEAVIESDEGYTKDLELGSSQKAPRGIFRTYRPEYGAILEAALAEAMQEALDRAQPLGPAVSRGFEAGVVRVLRAIEAHTPVKTGRARSSWVAKLPSGRTVQAIKVVGNVAAYQRRRRRGA